VGGVIDIYKAFITAFPGIGRVIDDFFKQSGDEAQGFTKALVSLFFTLAKSAATAVNSIVDIFTDLNRGNFISNFVEAIVAAFALVGGGFATLASGLVGIISDVLLSIDQLAAYYSRKFPKISELIGLDNVNFSGLARGLRESVGVAAGALGEGLLNIADKGVPGLTKLNQNLDSVKINLEDIDGLQSTALKAIGDISDKYSQTKKDFGTVETEITVQLADGTLQTFKQNIDRVTGDASRNKIGIDIDDETLGNLEKLKTATKDAKIDAKLTIKDDQRTRNIADYIIEKVGGVNWPQAMQAIMDAMLTMLIAAVADEQLPIAITNFRA
jgi:uncharacterized protein YjbK